MALTTEQVTSETERLIELLKWGLTEEGIEYHTVDKGSEFNYSIVAGMLEDLVNDAINTNEYSPAYVIGYLACRIWAQQLEYRSEIEKVFNFNGLDGLHWDLSKIKKDEL